MPSVSISDEARNKSTLWFYLTPDCLIAESLNVLTSEKLSLLVEIYHKSPRYLAVAQFLYGLR
jgi:methionine synthase II (cobalamin-independent)